MWRQHARRRVALRIALGMVFLSAFIATPVPAAVSDADKKTLAEMALQWAIDGGISDVKLVKDPENPIVANVNLPKNVKLELPGRKISVLAVPRIQAEANRGGDFLYFRFNRFEGDQNHVKVAIALIWAVGEHSKTQYLSGGGATLDFEKRDGKWQLQPVMNRWMS